MVEAGDITQRDSFGERLRSEVGGLRQAVGNRWFALFLLICTLAITAAYQAKLDVSLTLGNSYDCPYLGKTYRCPLLDDWNAGERDPSDGTSYRWSKGISPLRFVGVGNQPLKLTLHLSGARPGGAAPPTMRAAINGRDYTWPTTAPFSDQSFSLPRQPNLSGNLDIILYPPTFSPPKDARELGVRVAGLRLESAGGLVLPDPLAGASLLLGLALLWLFGYRAWASWRGAASVGLGGLLLVCAGLVANRVLVSSFAAPLAVTLLWAGLLWLLLLLLLPRSWADERARGWLAAAVTVAFALRFGGMVHPQFISIDLNFQAEKLAQIVRFFKGSGENFYFQSELPNGTPVPYPSAFYVLLSPFSLLLGGGRESDQLLLRFAVAICEAGAGLAVYRFALRLGPNAALFAASLFAVGPAVYDLLSAGTLSNVFGQVMFVVALACAVEVLSRRRSEAGYARWLAAYAGFSLLTLLGHYGSAIASVVVTGTVGLLWLLFAPSGMRGRIWPLTGVFVSTLIAAYLLYYVHYNAQIGGQIANLLSGGKQYHSAEFSIRFDLPGLLGDVVQGQGWVILPLAIVGGLLLLLQRNTLLAAEGDNTATRLVLLGWTAAGLLLTASGLFDRYTVRYNMILLPLLCVWAGIALQWLAGRSRSLAGGLLLAAATYALVVWAGVVLTGYH